jgi:hypothetical protein
MNKRLPSGLGSGQYIAIGPAVNWTGSRRARWKKPAFSRSAQIFDLDWNTKYFPSGVQLPQQVYHD